MQRPVWVSLMSYLPPLRSHITPDVQIAFNVIKVTPHSTHLTKTTQWSIIQAAAVGIVHVQALLVTVYICLVALHPPVVIPS